MYLKKNPNKECYRGLTYEYMRSYIERYESDVDSALKELEDMIFDSKCHSKGYRYPTVKKWFLTKYPEVAKFGVEFEKIGEIRPLITSWIPAIYFSSSAGLAVMKK